jgi:hypothetical protein
MPKTDRFAAFSEIQALPHYYIAGTIMLACQYTTAAEIRMTANNIARKIIAGLWFLR